ncbi:30S ribosomal protein S27ae [Candidatus Woesearchaeota archaeon]|nr:30S ribosomal protein S27ae [Candidatus Woesearchaeota archaeon]
MAKTEKKGKAYTVSKLYDKGRARNRTCPKCGQGHFLAQHKDRVTCGKCHYTEFLTKKN